jgi:hypothetical protein
MDTTLPYKVLCATGIAMTVFDLLFVVLFLASLGTLIVAAVSPLQGRRGRALVLLRRLGVVLAFYFCALILVSALTPQRFRAIGVDQCSDDWCIAVQSVRRDTTRAGIGYEVTFRLASRARRVAQRQRFVAVYLLDERGGRYAPVTDATEVPFDTLLQPEETLAAIRRFLVPSDARVAGLVVARGGGGWFPGCCIIGDQGSLFHRRTIVKLD